MASNRDRLHAKKSQVERLKQEIAALEEQQARRIGGIALQAGLGDLAVDEDTLREAFQSLAERLRAGGPAVKPIAPSTPAPDAPSASRAAGTVDATPAGHTA